MISKFGLHPGGSWIVHSACQSCTVGGRTREGDGCGQRDCANVPVWVRDAKDDKAPFIALEEGWQVVVV